VRVCRGLQHEVNAKQIEMWDGDKVCKKMIDSNTLNTSRWEECMGKSRGENMNRRRRITSRVFGLSSGS